MCVARPVQHLDLRAITQQSLAWVLLRMQIRPLPSYPSHPSHRCLLTHLFTRLCSIRLSQSDIVPQSFLDFRDPDT